MRTVAFVSALGGVGCTTLVAHSAALLAERGHPVVALELSAQNTLGLYLGMREQPPTGWHSTVQAGGWLGDAALENADGVRLLAHGPCAAPLPLAAPWLAQQLQALDVPDPTVVLLDTPPLPAPLAQQALACADVVLVVLDAAWRSMYLHASLQALLAGLQPHQRVGMVVTGVDPRSPSRRDALAQLRLQWPGQLLPYVLHQDEHLPQAQAQGLCVHQMAPYAQAAHDLQGIANWLEQTLAQLPLVRPTGGI